MGGSRSGERSTGAWRRTGWLALVLALSASALWSGVLPAQADSGSTPATATTIGQLPFNSGQYAAELRSGPAATGTEIASVAARCNSGRPLYRPQWSSYTAPAATRIVARGQVEELYGRDHVPLRDGVAVLSAGSGAVLDCSVSSGEVSTGPVALAAGARVLVVQFLAEETGCEDDSCLREGVQSVHVAEAAGYPANDDWTAATSITSLPFTQTVDATLASSQAADGVATPANCETSAYYNRANRTTWWSFTPATSGTLQVSVQGTPLDRDAFWEASLAELTTTGPRFLEPCGSSPYPPVFQAGTTYLVEVGAVLDSYVSSVGDLTVDGPVTLSVAGDLTLRKGPDLVVTDVSWAPTAPVAGTPVRFRATVKNQGPAATQGGVVHGVSFRVDGRPVTFADSWTAALPPGGTVTLTANGGPTGETWAATAGRHTVEARVDDVNRLAEADETNNARSRALDVGAAQGRSDLVVTAVTATPASPAPGAAVVFRATVKNQGTSATPAGTVHRVAFRVDGTTRTWSATRTAALAAGASVTLVASAGGTSGAWTATAGPHTVQAVLDDLGRITESDEANNTRDLPLQVGAAEHRPDLVVTAVSWAPSRLVAGAPVRFSATIKNRGTLTTPDVVHGVSFRVDGAAVTFSDTSAVPLHPGQSTTLTANGGAAGPTWAATTGTHTLRVVVDDVNRIPGEADESNNQVDRVILVG